MDKNTADGDNTVSLGSGNSVDPTFAGASLGHVKNETAANALELNQSDDLMNGAGGASAHANDPAKQEEKDEVNSDAPPEETEIPQSFFNEINLSNIYKIEALRLGMEDNSKEQLLLQALARQRLAEEVIAYMW